MYNDLRMLVREGLVEERVETIRLSRYYSCFGSYGNNGCFEDFGAWVRFINPLQYNGLKLQMKGSKWSVWSPDSPLDEGMKTRHKRGKPVQTVPKITVVSKR
ncbi:hypothetical protein Smar_0580 [Staphylothermus marinus F1]|uniref:Uncharacterized protein n=1 Tax=Staphylothermus marinus (strain ATCC 43588 / DSM 3639 / JCM 9404 / F1) TaxID=399550 RepID=A3DM27_STAMF|nr:hypothetical protein Smar_0580 [Staphylothermus marinus F1]